MPVFEVHFHRALVPDMDNADRAWQAVNVRNEVYHKTAFPELEWPSLLQMKLADRLTFWAIYSTLDLQLHWLSPHTLSLRKQYSLRLGSNKRYRLYSILPRSESFSRTPLPCHTPALQSGPSFASGEIIFGPPPTAAVAVPPLLAFSAMGSGAPPRGDDIYANWVNEECVGIQFQPVLGGILIVIR